ncbi:MAG: cytidine deaminase [Deltaproteobacteria bacterium]|nr:MAG: cytidine deaminase [Deltaproteobacteria bacterium]
MTDDELAAELIERARAASERAYAPYSNYFVGCAVWAGGAIYHGANVENVSFGAVLCAERAAIAAAVIDGARQIDVLALFTHSSPPAAPCGLCRQTLQEFAPDPHRVRVLMANAAGEREETTLAELLPRGFRRADLEGGRR